LSSDLPPESLGESRYYTAHSLLFILENAIKKPPKFTRYFGREKDTIAILGAGEVEKTGFRPSPE
jgi:hypothetical protein